MEELVDSKHRLDLPRYRIPAANPSLGSGIGIPEPKHVFPNLILVDAWSKRKVQ